MNYNRGRFKDNPVAYQPPTNVIQSSMTCQQQYQQIVDSMAGSLNSSKKLKGCAIHPNISLKCRKCKQLQLSSSVTLNQTEIKLCNSVPSRIKLHTENPLSSLNQKLLHCLRQNQIKQQNQKKPATVKQLVNSVPHEEIDIGCYLPGTSHNVTKFITLFYQLIKMRPTYQQMVIMLRHKNVNVKALAMLYIRSFCVSEDIYGWLADKFADYDLINAETMVSQFAIRLLDENQMNYDGMRLPRIPVKLQKAINERIEQMKAQTIGEVGGQADWEERSRSRSRDKRKAAEDQCSHSSSGSPRKPLRKQKKPLETESKLSLEALRDKVKAIEEPKTQKIQLLAKYRSNHDNESEQVPIQQSESEEKYIVG